MRGGALLHNLAHNLLKKCSDLHDNFIIGVSLDKEVKVKVPILIVERRGPELIRTLGSQPAGDSMHGHEPGGGLRPPPTRPTAKYTCIS